MITRAMIGAPLVLATHRPPWPLDNGSRIRTARLAQGLSERFDLTLVTFADGPVYDDTLASRADLEQLLPGARIELVPFGRPHPRGARRGVARRGSVTWGAYDTPSMRAALARVMSERPEALLHLDGPGAALAGLGLAPGLAVYSGHNIEHRIVREVLARRPLTHRPFLEVEWRKIALEERRCWRAADLCVAVSEPDAEAMLAGGARRVEVVPNGADAHDPLPVARRAEGDPLRLMFVGSGAYWPYEHGLAWFAQEVMPLLGASSPVAFDVVGERPEAPVAGEGIAYHGRVPDVRPFYESAHGLVVPVFEGSGTRLKLVEAAMFGRPVISTALGAEGLPLRAGDHYARAETPSEWVAAVEQLSSGALDQMPARARAALADYTWPRIADSLAETYAQMTSTR